MHNEREHHAEDRMPEGVIADPFIQRVAAELLASLPALTDELVERIVASDPFYAQAMVIVPDEVRKAVEENLGQVMRGLAGLEPLDFELTRELAKRRAAQGVPVSALLHAYRLAAQVIWEHHVEAGHNQVHGEFGLDEVLDGAAKLWALTNTYSSVVSQAYDDTAGDRARASERERTLLLDALFEGRNHDLPGIADTARLLDLPDRGHFVVVIAENVGPGKEGIPGVEQALRFAGFRSAWRLRTQRQIGVVVIEPGTRGSHLVAGRDVVAARAEGRVGVSPIYDDLADSARFVSLADLALSCLPPGKPAVALFDDHPLGTIVARSPDLSERIGNLVLGPILDLDDDERTMLLETLHAWIEVGGSATKAGERLYCHRNTVRNRLQRVESLTRRRLSDPTSLAEICLAVKAVNLIPALRVGRSPRATSGGAGDAATGSGGANGANGTRGANGTNGTNGASTAPVSAPATSGSASP
jgi:hypothetical protein